MKSIESVAAMRRNRISAMREQDLAELYKYLLLFRHLYDDCEREVEKLCEAVKSVFMMESRVRTPEEADDAMRRLRNPGNAGRKSSHTNEQRNEVVSLSQSGMSIREIARKTSIPKSTVQRMLFENRYGRG